MTDQQWEFWIDRGGTFTDVVARHPDGGVSTHKLLSENPNHYADAAIQGIKDILNAHRKAHGLAQLTPDQPLPERVIGAVKMGTTVATNALLERRGAATLLVTTRGFADALRIGEQARPDLFALRVQLPEMLYGDVLEAEERVAADGEILTPLDEAAARRGLEQFYATGYRGVAIALLHGYRQPCHEIRLAEIARAVGFTQVSVSHQVSPLMKLIPRGDTTVVDAYLSPVLRRYVEQVAAQMPGLARRNGLMFMRSGGGLTDAQFFQGKDAVLSGPAGGVVGMARVSLNAGFKRVIGFDMGGTSTDVSHYNGEGGPAHKHAHEHENGHEHEHANFERTLETRVAGVRLRAPMMLLHTVAAGGGSVLHFDGARYRVGPDSAGANPGPACYRNGGPLTITDCNVLLGKLQPDLFPQVFGDGSQSLDAQRVTQEFGKLAAQINETENAGEARSAEEVASGFLAVAVENMANAIKKISVQRGYDVTRYALCCFGGAGGQHACLVADALGMTQILFHPCAGVLSAYGMGLADTVVERQQAVEAVLTKTLLSELEAPLRALQAQCVAELRAQNVGSGADGDADTDAEFVYRRTLRLRYEGSDSALEVRYAAQSAVVREFETLHRMRFGFASTDKAIVVESVEVEARKPAPRSTLTHAEGVAPRQSVPRATRRCYMDGGWRDCPFYARDRLAVERWIEGPAVIFDPTGTVVVEIGWRAKLSADNDLILARFADKPRTRAVGTAVDPVMLEIFNNLFMSIAEQMGVVLENTAASVNIKERLDFSCAIFDPDGALVANAPHMPVHLGSMSESIKTVIAERGASIRPGDAYMLNAPYNGGTHLPDVTLIRPVFVDKQLLFYVASRGHHADIGGKTPGSAPADSTRIDEEGVLLDNVLAMQNGEFREREIDQLLRNAPLPARNPEMNIADFKAQLAACEKGAQELAAMTAYYGREVVHAYMKHVQDNAEENVRRVLGVLKDGAFCYEMDDGSRIQVAIRVHNQARRAVVDFSGSSPQHPGNFNAPTAVVHAAVLYVFRCLVNDNIPLNEGCLRPLEIIIPPKSMLSPEHPAAVIAGNVETSQYVVDALLGALGCAGASQGTMNNFIWGNAQYQYYETICGGSGATPDADGADAVHTHMTNSRLTDPEILEWRFPVRLESFAIRKNSGGAGKFRGGDGVVRRVRFLQPMLANLISGHRKIPPYGMRGGEPGAVGRNYVQRANGTVSELPGVAQVSLETDDVMVIETPGGGGYGATEK